MTYNITNIYNLYRKYATNGNIVTWKGIINKSNNIPTEQLEENAIKRKYKNSASISFSTALMPTQPNTTTSVTGIRKQNLVHQPSVENFMLTNTLRSNKSSFVKK